jgi:CrcB protein
MNHLILVAAGGAIGASLRHLINLAALRIMGPAFPVGTLLVNLLGCLAMGLLISVAARHIDLSAGFRLFAATGLLGGFTTFSAFALDFTTLWQRGETVTALAYVLLSVILSLGALLAGLWLGRSFG